MAGSRPWAAAVAVWVAAAAGAVVRTVWDGAYTGTQAGRGEALFARQCASCHGADLAGAGEAPALRGARFLTSWNGLPLSDLFTRMRETMPYNEPGRLSARQNADLLAYLLRANGFPAGEAELSAQADALQQIRLEKSKPQ